MGADAVKNFRACSSRESRPSSVGVRRGAGAMETTTPKVMLDITTTLRQRCFPDGDTPKVRGIAWGWPALGKLPISSESTVSGDLALWRSLDFCGVVVKASPVVGFLHFKRRK